MNYENLFIGKTSITGYGSDAIGKFELKGWRNEKKLGFVKHYNDHCIFFQGEQLGKRYFKGTSEKEGVNKGKWELTSHRHIL